MTSDAEINKILAVLVAAYPNARIVQGANGTPGTMQVYATMLVDIPPQELIAAIKYCISTKTDFLPSVADIRNAWNKIKSANDAVSGQDAWRIVQREIARCGLERWDCGDKQPEYDGDEDIRRAVACIGWREICMADETDPAVRAQFIRAYETYKQRSKEMEIIGVIPEARRIIGNVAKRLEAKSFAKENAK